jgi:di/tricarboxylate transporter
MTFQQGLSFAIVGAAVAMFAWGRFRYDAISLAALLVGVLTGVVDEKHAFTGFSSDVVVIIASALIVSAAISRSGVIEPIVAPLIRRLETPQSQVPVMAGATGLFAMVNKNVGALAALMPVAIRLGRSEKSSPSLLLMPMSFMALLGGLVTLVGTSTNIIVSQVRENMFGHPFRFFDFAPVGLGLTFVGFLSSASAGACCRAIALLAPSCRTSTSTCNTPPRRACRTTIPKARPSPTSSWRTAKSS